MSSARKPWFEKFTWDLKTRNCFRNVGLHLKKYRCAVYKSIHQLQGVPIKVNEIKVEITLEILGLGDQLDIYGKLRHEVT